MLHASGMTSFWSPHIPADPLLLLLLVLLLLTLAHKPVYLRLSRVSPDCARHSAFLLSDRRRATLPPSPPILQSSHPLLSSSPLLSSPLVLGRVYYRWDSRINSCVCAHRVLRGEWKSRRCRSRKKNKRHQRGAELKPCLLFTQERIRRLPVIQGGSGCAAEEEEEEEEEAWMLGFNGKTQRGRIIRSGFLE